MTATTLPRPTAPVSLPTPAERLAELKAMLEDEACRADWPEIRAAIVYLTVTATTVLGA